MPYIKCVNNLLRSLLNSYSDIFFVRGALPGGIVLAITLINYNAGISGILSILSAYAVARLLGYQATFLGSGYFTYNALLVGLAIGYMFEISVLSLLMIIIAGALTMIITIVLAQVFHQLFGLQILSVPFILVSILVYLSSASFTNLYVASLYSPPFGLNLDIFPFWLSGYLKALGAVIFMPNEITGLLIAMLLLLSSRILFVLSISGFMLGIALYGLFTGSIETAARDVSGFNYILIAMAIGGIFNIPSVKSYILAFMGVAFATLIASAGQILLSQYSLPIFTLPFTIVTLSFIYALNLLEFPFRTLVYKGTPEQNLEHYLSNKGRFVENPVALSLPFYGQWHCWQGFNGEWTHKGLYQHAYDFVIIDSDQNTFHGDGKKLTDYYCFGKEVASPVRGRIVKVIHYLPDNPVGSVDTINNWGNEITIEDSRGYIVKLAHFSAHSIYVVEGQWVDVGTILGLCGNSGNSPQPHIHIQAQADYTAAAATVPFVFVNYYQLNTYHVSGEPEVHKNVTNSVFNVFYDQLTNFVLDEVFEFDIYEDEIKVDILKIQVKMSDYSGYYFESEKGKLFFGKQYGNFYFYGYEGDDLYLEKFHIALSMLPLSYSPDRKWVDNINNSLVVQRWQENLAGFLNSFNTGWVTTSAEYTYLNENTVTGKICNNFFDVTLETKILLDPVSRFREIEVGNIKMIQRVSR